ncbi:MAG: hypothetical protein FWC38_09430 [Proteobacteria bacterium]|nr:hypothetical protein [Pseudomonadota bacterium]MCL2308418.1 hypothetical protein [Pseudomonadota bacterium]
MTWPMWKGPLAYGNAVDIKIRRGGVVADGMVADGIKSNGQKSEAQMIILTKGAAGSHVSGVNRLKYDTARLSRRAMMNNLSLELP